MDLELIRGNTYYLKTPGSLVGVYRLAEGKCILIDSGDRAGNAGLILDTLRQAGLKVQGIINTHAHADHCAGNHRIQAATNCDIYASALESYAIEEPMIGLYGLYSANPLRVLKNRFLLAEPSWVTYKVESDLTINGESFEILDLRGHSAGQIGVVTPDGVLFAGDSLIQPAILDEFSFLYMIDIAGQLQTLEHLKPRPEIFFLAHGGIIPDVEYAIKRNRDLLDNMTGFIKNLLSVPLTREQIIER
ncbi:MAG TPA: MBL fold metallo-hydrolase, partial [Syntrophomonas sp.]|nr:MBL fold metallo-hydrolase [Syntrophomonas sp.]